MAILNLAYGFQLSRGIDLHQAVARIDEEDFAAIVDDDTRGRVCVDKTVGNAAKVAITDNDMIGRLVAMLPLSES